MKRDKGMKREKSGVIVLAVLGIFLLLSVSVVSASLIEDVGNWLNKLFNGKESSSINSGELGNIGVMVVNNNCTETDYGLDYFNFGITKKGNTQYSDYCSGLKNLTEYYCQNNNIASVNVTCYTHCTGGKCIACISNCTGKQCGDDGCGGRCGTCSGTNSKCNSNGQCVQCLTNTDCSTGQSCSNGLCTSVACTETDYGQDYYNFGITKKGNIQYSDYCPSLKVLTEYYCASNNITSINMTCYVNCTGGKCIACISNCTGKQCGDDGCGGRCGTCSGTNSKCNSVGQCKQCLINSDCPSGQTCNANWQCVANCTAETNTAFCSRLGKNCNSVTANDNCGTSRKVNCGTCTSPQTCNSTGQCINRGSENNVTISMATLKDIYSINEQIKLTDPPDNANAINNIYEDKIIYNQENNYINLDTDINKSAISNSSQQIPKSLGYIVEFSDEPSVVKYTKLKKEAKANQEKIFSMNRFNPLKYLYSAFLLKEKNIPAKINDYENIIKYNNKNIKEKIKKALGKPVHSLMTGNAISNNEELIVISEWNSVFNGIVLNVSAEEAEKIKEIPGVKSVSPNLEVYATLMDSVPLIGANQVWRLDKDGNNCNNSGKECLTGKGIRIGIIDTGIDYTHPDLGGCTSSQFLAGGCLKVVGGYDFVNRDNDPMDDHGHGTHVAGIAAGNGLGGLKGVAPDAKLYAYKVLNSGGSGSFEQVISGIERAVDPNQDGDFSDHVDVISMSLGGNCGGFYYDDCGPNDPGSQAVNNAVDTGVIAVIAAGNAGPESFTIGTPGTAKKAITVGATYKKDYPTGFNKDINPKTDNITYFSSRGPVRDYFNKPDIVAPGALICSARYDSIYPEGENKYYKPCLDNKHIQLAGTSMAAPMVAGAAALLKQKHPDWTPDDIKYLIKNTAINLNYNSLIQGSGRINLTKAVEINQKPIIAEILTSGKIKGTETVGINGTASGYDFFKYSVYYSNKNDYENNINNWVLLDNSNPQVIDNVLFNWDINSIKDGEYVLKLIVNTSDNYYEDYSFINIIRTEISYPKDLSSISSYWEVIPTWWGKLNISGTSSGDNFNHYELQICNRGYDGNFLGCTKNGITLYNNGHSEIINNRLGTLNLSVINLSNYYKIILTTYYNDSSSENSSSIIYIEPDLLEGWPQKVGDTSISTPAVADINNDGKMEIASNSYSGEVYLFFSNGSIVNGWPKNTGQFIMASPVIADIDNDGSKDIIVATHAIDSNNGYIYIWDNNGTLKSGWPVLVPSGMISSPAVADINNDGKMEIVVDTFNYFGTFVYYFNGSIVNGWPQSCGAYRQSTPVLADINNDGNMEIISSSLDIDIYGNWMGLICSRYLNGTSITGWPIQINNTENLISSPAIADLNNDNKTEITFGNFKSGGKGDFYLFYSNGSIVNGWPKNTSNYFEASPAIADINNDGKREIVVANRHSVLYVWDMYGNDVTGFPKDLNKAFISSPAIANIDSDLQKEIIVSSFNNLYLIDNNGQFIGNSKLFSNIRGGMITFPSHPSPLIADINNDGKLDIILGSLSGEIYIWTTNSGNKGSWPMFQHDPQHTGCYDCYNKTLLIRPQSKLVNNENFNITGNLVMILQKKDTNGNWINENIAVNESLTIPVNGLLKLDTGKDSLGNQAFEGFNNLNVNASSSGQYRIYVKFEYSGKSIDDNWEFKVV